MLARTEVTGGKRHVLHKAYVKVAYVSLQHLLLHSQQVLKSWDTAHSGSGALTHGGAASAALLPPAQLAASRCFVPNMPGVRNWGEILRKLKRFIN